MARKVLVECSFLIPIRRDTHLAGGGRHSVGAWKWLRDQLYDFGGATRALENYEGWYIDPDSGQRVRDVSRKYVVAVPLKDVEAVRVLLREACAVFQQKRIYLSVAGQVEFVEGPDRETK